MARNLRPLFLLSLVLSLSTCSKTQSLEIAECLAQHGLIKKSERSQITSYLKKVTSYSTQPLSPSSSGVLAALTEVEYKEFGVSNKYYSYISFDTAGVTTQDSVEIHARLKAYLGKLNACGLIAQSQYENYVHKIDDAAFIHELQLLSVLAPEVACAEWMKSDNFPLFVDSLFFYKVVSDNRYSDLKSDIQAGKIVSHYQLINYCSHAASFDFAAYSDDPPIYLKEIHSAVAALLPALSFTDFEYIIKKDTLESSPDYDSYMEAHNDLV